VNDSIQHRRAPNRCGGWISRGGGDCCIGLHSLDDLAIADLQMLADKIGQPPRVVEPLNPPLPSNRLNAREKLSLVKEHALRPLYEGITEQRAPVFDRTV
jgi:hypothetical protein